MQLRELLSLRSIPLAGISLGLTRRCPLSCAHCSTNSMMTSEQHPASLFTGFVASFTASDHPEVVSMSGGEAMLRPKLVKTIAEKARKVGTRSSCLSGGYFANADKIPRNIEDAIRSLDHFSISMDIFHEAEVSRAKSFQVLEQVLRWEIPVSIHLVGRDHEDPYISEAVAGIRRHFADQVPVLVNSLGWHGRARDWIDTPEKHAASATPMPCSMAAWPVVSYDGTVVACGNDDAIDALPAHLTLGHVATDSWNTIRTRSQTSHALRAIRLFGPQYMRETLLLRETNCAGFCGNCLKLALTGDDNTALETVMTKPSTAIMERAVAVMHAQGGSEAFARIHGMPQMSQLVTLGADE